MRGGMGVWRPRWAAAALALIVLVLAQNAPRVRAAADQPVVRIPEESLVLVERDGRLNILSQLTVVNSGNAAEAEIVLPVPHEAIGARGRAFPIDPAGAPEAAYDLLTDEAPDALVDHRPLEAGEVRRYQLSYQLPFGGGYLRFQRAVGYYTDTLFLVVRDGELTAASPGLVDEGTRPFQGVPVRLYRIGPAERGMVVGALVARPGVKPPVLTWPLVGLGLATLAAVMLTLWLLLDVARRMRRPRALSLAPTAPETGTDASRQSIIRTIAALDVSRQRGEISEPAWREERERLIGLYRQLEAEAVQAEPAAEAR